MRVAVVGVLMLWTGSHLAAIASPRLRVALTGDAAPFLVDLTGPWIVAGVLGALGLSALMAAPRFSRRQSICLAAGWLGACLALAWGDAVSAAREARAACAMEVGLQVHERLRVRGILGLSDIEHWQAAGFSRLERRLPDGRVERWTWRAGQPRRQFGARPLSEVEYLRLPERVIGRAGVLRTAVLRSRRDGRVLAEARELVLNAGWAQRFLGFGLRQSPRICRSPLPDPPGVRSFELPDDLIERTLVPARPAPSP